MDWFLLVMLGSPLLAISTILQRSLLRDKDSDPLGHTISFQILTAAAIFLFALFNGFSLAGFENFLPNIAFMSVAYAAASLLYFKSLKLAEASEVAVLNSTRSLWAALAASAFLGEVLTKSTITGTLLIMGGVAIVSYKSQLSKFNKGHLFVLASAVLYGAAFVNDAFVVRSVNVPTYVGLSYILPATVLILFRRNSVASIKYAFISKEKIFKRILIAALAAGSSIMLYLAAQIGPASEIFPVRQVYVLFTVVLAVIFLKERSNLGRKFLGALLVIAGVILLR